MQMRQQFIGRLLRMALFSLPQKGGKPGKMKLELNIQQGWGRWDPDGCYRMDSQYMEMRKEAKRNDNAPVGFFEYDLDGTWDTTRSTDCKKS